ncbi:hypothetical protein [Candidatus Nitrospira inopinata]|uniref:DUF5666 domain-containing protein n=1 Tax=Candidatus Nitrospira inopinata TaxID=1715989 RepID=A0A0S4KQU5_9BACT|nr:hypothetical protein [Candidatus Nitrospira inopinata]CUQ65721.1 exported protein of unknown function [Candidatus Nitrospira inopinata]
MMRKDTTTLSYGGIRGRTLSALFLSGILAASLAAAVPIMSHAGEVIQRTVRGTVVATNVEANPQIIVVKVVLPSKEEMIVGARVSADTKITKGKQAAQLADLKAGQTAEVTYLKTSDGLLAQSIRAH